MVCVHLVARGVAREVQEELVKTYQGGCHCGAVRFAVDLDMEQVISCNCSHCSAKGLILTFTRDGFRLESGEDALTTYLFNKKHIRHLFCRHCGVQSFSRGKTPDGQDMVAVNVRCLEGVDIAALNPTPVNGKDF